MAPGDDTAAAAVAAASSKAGMEAGLDDLSEDKMNDPVGIGDRAQMVEVVEAFDMEGTNIQNSHSSSGILLLVLRPCLTNIPEMTFVY